MLHLVKLLRKHQGPIYIFADSSPQVGVDWFMSILQLIQDDDLQQCTEAADYLVASVQQFKEAVDANDLDTMLEITDKRPSSLQ